MKFSQILFLSGAFVAVSSTAIIDPNLQSRFASQKHNVMVSFAPGIDSVVDQINSQSFPSAQAKRSALVKAEESYCNGAQAPLKAMLKTMGVGYQSYSINNKMFLENVDSRVISAIAQVPGVEKVEKEPVMELSPFEIGEPEDFGRFGRQANSSSPEWGIRKIKADQVWGSFQGEGVVVAGIDTGVRVSHVSLRDRWRKQYGWYDPLLWNLTSRPYDLNGHGTHTMGTIVGSGGIGVAPRATWIACKGCTSLSCPSRALTACGQWVTCPDPDTNCTFSPQVVSNSWGGGQGGSWYDSIIKCWHSAGIIPIFAIGNEGPNCGTASSPGDRQGVIGVGSTEETDQISRFSSLGPTVDGELKPDIAAPGGKIRSAWHTNDTAYNTISGTSMACPHVAGVVTLMLEKNPALKYPQVYDITTGTTNNAQLNGTTAASCGPASNSEFPNNVFGYGLIDALAAVSSVP